MRGRGAIAGRLELTVPCRCDRRIVDAPRLAAEALGRGPTTSPSPAALLALVDDVVLPGWRFADLETAADEVRAEAAEAGRDPASLGVAALVPVSIGRTEAEARARADADAVFARVGHPAAIGIFGTLEECQDRVIALAHAGITRPALRRSRRRSTSTTSSPS